MPIYDFICNECHASRSVLTDYETKNRLTIACTQCGGVMKAAPINLFNVIGSAYRKKTSVPSAKKVKSCGHTYHCQCAAIKQSKPNPFQKQIDQALGKNEH